MKGSVTKYSINIQACCLNEYGNGCSDTLEHNTQLLHLSLAICGYNMPIVDALVPYPLTHSPFAFLCSAQGFR